VRERTKGKKKIQKGKPKELNKKKKKTVVQKGRVTEARECKGESGAKGNQR
jgi:hypothetical protein